MYREVVDGLPDLSEEESGAWWGREGVEAREEKGLK
jgi:hypothetical protein